MITEVPGSEQLKVDLSWQPSNWLPVFIDSRLKSLAFSRKGLCDEISGSRDQYRYRYSISKCQGRYSLSAQGFLRRVFYAVSLPDFSKRHKPRRYPHALGYRFRNDFSLSLLSVSTYGRVVLEEKARVLDYHPLGHRGDSHLYPGFPEYGVLYRFRYGFIMSLAALGILKAAMLFPKVNQASG